MKNISPKAIALTAVASVPLIGGPLLLLAAWELTMLPLLLLAAGSAITFSVFLTTKDKS